jgi:hypothetical protein
MLTKKECIWLGIRAIGLYWLLHLLYTIIMLICFMGMWLIVRTRMNAPGGFALTFTNRLLGLPLPLFMTIYFLFFGTFIYKLINHFVRTQPENPSRPAGYCYCEILIRFLGLWAAFFMLMMISMPFRISLQQALLMVFSPAHSSGSNPFAMVFRSYLTVEMLLSTGLYLILLLMAAWYFLKRGKLFILLLHRLWMKKIGQSPGVQSGL